MGEFIFTIKFFFSSLQAKPQTSKKWFKQTAWLDRSLSLVVGCGPAGKPPRGAALLGKDKCESGGAPYGASFAEGQGAKDCGGEQGCTLSSSLLRVPTNVGTWAIAWVYGRGVQLRSDVVVPYGTPSEEPSFWGGPG